jgi:hypothetical protein
MLQDIIQKSNLQTRTAVEEQYMEVRGQIQAPAALSSIFHYKLT